MNHLVSTVFRRVIALILLAAPAAPAQEMPLTRLAEVRMISHESLAQHPTVRVRGVVTSRWHRSTWSNFCVQDDSAGIWVSMDAAHQRQIWQGDPDVLASLREGLEIELVGVLDPGGFAPVILPSTLRVLGEKPLPPAQVLPLARLMSGAEGLKRVELSGVVQSCLPYDKAWRLRVETGLGFFLARVPISDGLDPATLEDAEVRLRGVATSVFNARGEFVRPRLFVGEAKDVAIEKAAPTDPFSVPKVALAALAGFSPEGRSLHRCRIEGTVTYFVPGFLLYLQEGDCAVRINTTSKEPLRLGDRVEVSGFMENEAAVAGLTGALVSKLGTAAPPPPRPIAMADIVKTFKLVKSNHPPSPRDHDGLLVSVTGRVLSVQRDAEHGGPRLVLDCAGALTTAELSGQLRAGGADRLEALRPGSLVRATGVAIVQHELPEAAAEFTEPTRLDLLLREGRDVTVLQAPSWWTPQRTFTALAGTLAVAVAALGWSILLRRRVAAQSREIARVMAERRDAAVEFQAALRERTRLAANLHDTTLQTMTGLAYQIEACEAETLPPGQRTDNHLETARRMVQRGQEDLRNAVWALRALPLEGRTITEALRTVARQVGAGHEVEISVESSGEVPALADFISGNLLLIAQEAMHNALKHARAAHLTVRLSAADDGQRVTLLIRDDGHGFIPGAQRGAEAGHFGLRGMRERAERLGGTLEVESQPATGTTIRADVPILPFDRELA